MGYATDVLALSPTAYWRMGESSFGTFKDSSGNGHDAVGDGTVTGLTLGATGLAPGADINGGISSSTQTASGALKVTQGSWMESGNISIAFAIKAASPPSSDLFSPITRRAFTPGTPWAIYIVSSVTSTTTPSTPVGGAYILSYDGTSFIQLSSTGVSICDGQVHHVVFTIATSGVNQTGTTYLDGVQTGTVSKSSGGLSVSNTNSHMNLVGEWSGSAYARTPIGTTDEIAYWAGTTLTSAQVASLHTSFRRGAVSY